VPADGSPQPLSAPARATDRTPPTAPERPSWIAIAVLVVLALGLRLGFLRYLAAEGFVWPDVDAYLVKGASLVRHGAWRWTFEAVDYAWGGRIYALPPLYSIYLSPFAAFASYPVNAFAGLAVLNAAVVPFVVQLGTRLHSARAGLIAGLLYACWGSDVAGFGAVRQEALYVPLIILAFAALARAWDGGAGRGGFVLAGAAFGLAALCRSMPIYWVALLAVVLWLRDRRGAGLGQAAALAAGFALLTVPYSIALSVHLGQPTLIENHGGILVAQRYLVSGQRQVPGFSTVVTAILTQVFTAPGTFFGATAGYALSLLPVNGGRFLQDGVLLSSAAAAAPIKWLVHASFDLPWLIAVVLAPLGVVLARHRPLALVLLGWALVNLGLTSVTGFGGSRLRCPFEVHLALLASVVLAGRWSAAPRLPLALGAAGTVAMALLIAPQVGRSLEARPNYGPRMRWTMEERETRATVTGGLGANLLTMRDGLDVTLTNPGAAPVALDLAVNGAAMLQAAPLAPGASRTVTVPLEGPELVFVEVHAADAARNPASVDFAVLRR
jgi:4-amino-4-deoxy-L-arabinose transferase-like glycosyltransferase